MSEWGGIPPEYRNQIVTGDARLLASRIPDESVDLVFTDPVYDRLEDYCWLAQVAARVLRPGGTLLAYYWGADLPSVASVMRHPRLVFRWNVFDLKIGTASLDGGKGARCMTRPALVFGKDFIDRSFWLSDVVYSRPQGQAANHVWSKNPSATRAWLAMLPPGLLWDPCAGGGTIPAVCRETGREFVAFEQDPDTAEKARQRVHLTTPPLFVLEPEPEPQLALEVSA
jgi:hypothetical protein